MEDTEKKLDTLIGAVQENNRLATRFNRIMLSFTAVVIMLAALQLNLLYTDPTGKMVAVGFIVVTVILSLFIKL